MNEVGYRATCYIKSGQFAMLTHHQQALLKKRATVILIDLYQDNILDMIQQRFGEFPFMEECIGPVVHRRSGKGFFWWLMNRT